MNLRNNVAYQNAGEIYIDGVTAQITGDHNLWFGVGAAPTRTTNNLNVDPLFVNHAGADFHLTSSSPTKDAGVTMLPNNSFTANLGTTPRDKDGVPRPQGTAFDMGAYEFFTGSSAHTTENPPPNVRVTVH
jgi:hypothetical protein